MTDEDHVDVLKEPLDHVRAGVSVEEKRSRVVVVVTNRHAHELGREQTGSDEVGLGVEGDDVAQLVARGHLTLTQDTASTVAQRRCSSVIDLVKNALKIFTNMAPSNAALRCGHKEADRSP